MGQGVATPTVNDQSLSSFFCFQFSHFYCFLTVSAGNHLDATCQTVCPARRFSPPCADGRADKRRKCLRRRLSSSFLSGGVFQKMKEFSSVVETKVHRNCWLLLLLFPKIFRNGFLMTGRLLFSCSFASPKCTWLEKKEKDFLSSFNARKGGVNTSSPLRLKFKFNTTRKRSWTRVVGSIFFYFHDGEQRADNLTVYRYHQQPIFMQLAICICKWKQRWLRWIRQTCIPDENRFVFTFFCLFLPIEKRKNVQSELFLW